MIDFKIDGGKLHHGTATGESERVVAEVCYMIALLYSGVRKADPEAAEGFRQMLLVAVNDERSHVWDGDAARQGIFMARRTE